MYFRKEGLMNSRIATIGPVIAAFLLVLALLLPGCASPKEAITVYHAGSLAVPFNETKALFEAANPNVEVLCEAMGSNAVMDKTITLIQAGEAPPDVIGSADYKLIPDRLYEAGYADWYIAFARNTMVLCYRDGAPGSEAIANGSRTWYDVLRNDAVSYGHSNPDADPCGYRALMVVQLAQKYYYDNATEFGLTPDPNASGLYDALIPGSEHDRGRVGGGKEVVRPKEVDLVASIQSGDLDYAFEYYSVATQHGLNFIELDDAVNLGRLGPIGDTNITYEDFYQEASVEIMTQPGPPPVYSAQTGAPVVYGVTILKDAPDKELAIKFVALLLSPQGQNVMAESGQPPIVPPPCDHPENLPPELAELL